MRTLLVRHFVVIHNRPFTILRTDRLGTSLVRPLSCKTQLIVSSNLFKRRLPLFKVMSPVYKSLHFRHLRRVNYSKVTLKYKLPGFYPPLDTELFTETC